MKYRFKIIPFNLVSRELMNEWNREDILTPTYTLHYKIPKRTIKVPIEKITRYKKTKSGCKEVWSIVGWENELVNWWETIYNVKVSKIRRYDCYRETYFFIFRFSLDCTPKEAAIIGKELDKSYESCTWKPIGIDRLQAIQQCREGHQNPTTDNDI